MSNDLLKDVENKTLQELHNTTALKIEKLNNLQLYHK